MALCIQLLIKLFTFEMIYLILITVLKFYRLCVKDICAAFYRNTVSFPGCLYEDHTKVNDAYNGILVLLCPLPQHGAHEDSFQVSSSEDKIHHSVATAARVLSTMDIGVQTSKKVEITTFIR